MAILPDWLGKSPDQLLNPAVATIQWLLKHSPMAGIAPATVCSCPAPALDPAMALPCLSPGNPALNLGSDS